MLLVISIVRLTCLNPTGPFRCIYTLFSGEVSRVTLAALTLSYGRAKLAQLQSQFKRFVRILIEYQPLRVRVNRPQVLSDFGRPQLSSNCNCYSCRVSYFVACIRTSLEQSLL